MRTNSISKRVIKLISIMAIVIAMSSTFSIKAQTDEAAYSLDISSELSSVNGCYTVVILYCRAGEHIICNFNNVYGKPYECTEHHCDGSGGHRKCIFVKS